MKIYEIIIKPHSFFITPLQGDILFGSLCWQLNNMGHNLQNLLKDYGEYPFMAASSGFLFSEKDNKYLLPKPQCPSYFMNKGSLPEKKEKDKCFFKVSADNIINLNKPEFDRELRHSEIQEVRSHNSVNRLTGTTGNGGEFAPYYARCFMHDCRWKIAVFIAIDESRISPETIKSAMENIGRSGYGKRASAGYGHFAVEQIRPSPLWHNKDGNRRNFAGCNALYALSAFVPSEQELKDHAGFYYQPITKYGKHGDVLALCKKPFKKPVIMADCASVMAFKVRLPENCIIGRAIKGLSYESKETVMQGYAICLPCRLEIYQ